MSTIKLWKKLVFELDVEGALILKNTQDNPNTNQISSLYHDLVQGLLQCPESWHDGRRLVYLLNYIGADINSQDADGDTALHVYLGAPTINLSVLEALVQCNADLYITNHEGRTPLMLGLLAAEFTLGARHVLMKYAPGLKKSVTSNDLMNVRKLINQGCSVYGLLNEEDSVVGDRSENITRLLCDIAPSMAVLHASMAGDVETVRAILTSKQPCNVNLRNMGHHGCTALYYAMCNNLPPLIDLLLSRSARLDVTLTLDGDDVAMLVKALSSRVITTATLQHVFARMSSDAVQKLAHRGDGLLAAGMKAHVTPDLFRTLLSVGGAQIVTRVNSENLSVRQQAEHLGQMCYIPVIDEVIHDWCTSESGTKHRRHLALRGFRHFPLLTDEHTSDSIAQFFSQLPLYRDCVDLFHRSVQDGDVGSVQQNLLCPQFSRLFDPCLPDSCTLESGQPALHKAVLRGHSDVVRLLADAIVYLKGYHIDSVRDQYERTGLHYAMAMTEGDDIIKVLQSLGASQHASDKNGETPLSFAERAHLPSMRRLISHHRSQNWSEAEPDPWSETLPPPIISYVAQRRLASRQAIRDSLAALTHHSHTHTTNVGLLQLTDADVSPSQIKVSPAWDSTRKSTLFEGVPVCSGLESNDNIIGTGYKSKQKQIGQKAGKRRSKHITEYNKVVPNFENSAREDLIFTKEEKLISNRAINAHRVLDSLKYYSSPTKYSQDENDGLGVKEMGIKRDYNLTCREQDEIDVTDDEAKDPSNDRDTDSSHAGVSGDEQTWCTIT